MSDLLQLSASITATSVLKFPEISPALISIGGFHLRWYALSYIAGIMLAWWYCTALINRPQLFGGEAPLTKVQLDDIMTWIILGIILGGRVGYVLFYMIPYQFDSVAATPLTIFKIWDGGMSFHGGLAGVTLAIVLFSLKHKLSLFSLGDIAGVVAPIGIGLARIANFINAELYGRPTDAPIGMIFPQGYVPGSTPPSYNFETGEWVYSGTEVARHPSQLYESVLEGWLPLVVLSLLIWKFGALKRPGLIAGLFLLMYGAGRTIVENFREPDSFVDALPDWFTMGMLLSIPMWAGGLWLVWNAIKQPEKRL